MHTSQHWRFGVCLTTIGVLLWAAIDVKTGEIAPDVETRSLAVRAETARIELIARLMPTVVCIFNERQMGGGSGVLIDAEGYGLTNYHVIASLLGTRKGLAGLSDGKLYELEVLGIDPGGDTAMFRLTGKERFDFAELGDSDSLSPGDRVLAVGNPFTLAEHYSPSVSMGVVTGVHRYQEGVRGGLLYTDCIQTDAAVNPGNSGGPLFDEAGKVIGINGRISPNWERGVPGVGNRFNVGLGYAISINQIRRFIPGLRAGLLVRHGTPQATVTTDRDGRVVFDQVMEDAPAWDAGIRPGDELIAFGGRAMGSPNDYANILGVYPEHWPVSVIFRRGNRRRTGVPLVACPPVFAKRLRLEPLHVPMKKPYEVDPEVNAKAAAHALGAYLRAQGAATSQPVTWQVRRTGVDANGQPFDVLITHSIDAEGGTEEIREQGGDLHVLRFNAGGIVGGATSTPIRTRALSDALYAVRYRANSGRWNSPSAEQDLQWSHIGADELLEMDSDGRETFPRLLEVIEGTIRQDIVVQLGFDTENHLLRRVALREPPTGLEVSQFLDDYRLVDGRWMPHTVRIDGAIGQYTERRSDGKVSR
ncbi:MAG: trypsin-like peptidase domain-containing protein [Planctomycetes bacterium]|nr:trypsin-like peptidase domain-containing protein [Planctomycetota bacterium]